MTTDVAMPMMQFSSLVSHAVRANYADSGRVCGNCGHPIAIYMGPDSRKWDPVEYEWEEVRTGLTLACGECW